ncbi:MAG: HAD family hydrolase [Clostridia bacterium]|nr:HAD family hydrolase [Clostridia bacterium]
MGTINKQVIEDAIKNNLHLLDERNISTELEEYEMFCKFYMHVLQYIKYPNITTDIVNKLAYDCVYNDEKVKFYNEVKEELQKLSKKYTLYIISDAWPSTYRVLKNYGIYDLFTKVYISSELGCKKSDKTLFEIALEDVDKNDENYFIDDRYDLLRISEQYGFIPVIIDRDKNQTTNYIEVETLTDLRRILELYEK